tara:strand:+ start:451 stop:672 length:222 start_codon:yes stop_codon:yes gene_type:complete
MAAFGYRQDRPSLPVLSSPERINDDDLIGFRPPNDIVGGKIQGYAAAPSGYTQDACHFQQPNAENFQLKKFNP